jgi:arylsulfatase A-like enzyme
MLRPRLLWILLALLAPCAYGERPPNILYVTVDDLGWKDVGYHGSAIRTPTLDKLAADGARLEQFYVQPYSTQTRAAALTGRYPMRYGLQTMQIQWFSEYALPEDERTLPQALRDAGYRTALIGKWHLGHARTGARPTQRGYQHFYGHLTGQIDYVRKTDRGGRPDWWRNDRALREDGHATALLAREAVAVVSRHDASAPLFLHLSFAAPQAPYQGAKPFIDYYAADDKQLSAYRAMITAVDSALKDVLDALDRRGMLGDTLVIFHSTTGGAVKREHSIGDGDTPANVANNGPYRDGRGSLAEGALRVVALAWWPGRVQRGTVTELMHAVDLYPTLLGLAGASPEQRKPLDGLDVWPAIAEGKPSPRKEVLLNVEEFRGALRVGDWKLIVQATLPGRVELYNLRADPSEEDNFADRDGERVRTMLRRLTEFAYDMAPALYLSELTKPRKVETPIYWGNNPSRP